MRATCQHEDLRGNIYTNVCENGSSTLFTLFDLILSGAHNFRYKLVLECFLGFVSILSHKVYFMRQYDIIHDDEKKEIQVNSYQKLSNWFILAVVRPLCLIDIYRAEKFLNPKHNFHHHRNFLTSLRV